MSEQRLIDANVLLKTQFNMYMGFLGEVPVVRVIDINRMPTIEAEPVRVGRWIVKNGRIVCDQCDAVYAVLANSEDELLDDDLQMVYKTEKFCFNCGAKMINCGAKMDGGADNG